MNEELMKMRTWRHEHEHVNKEKYEDVDGDCTLEKGTTGNMEWVRRYSKSWKKLTISLAASFNKIWCPFPPFIGYPLVVVMLLFMVWNPSSNALKLSARNLQTAVIPFNCDIISNWALRLIWATQKNQRFSGTNLMCDNTEGGVYYKTNFNS